MNFLATNQVLAFTGLEETYLMQSIAMLALLANQNSLPNWYDDAF